jgi:outer membrane lipoprotein-sorting protein
MQKRAAGIRTIRADFRQELQMTALQDKAVSTGVFYFRQPASLRLEYLGARPQVMVLNNGKAAVRMNGKTRSLPAKSAGHFAFLNRVIIDCVHGSILANKDFDASLSTQDGYHLISLAPVSKEALGYFKMIRVRLRKVDLSVARMEFHAPRGDVNRLDFTNSEFNVVLPDSLFRLH